MNTRITYNSKTCPNALTDRDYNRVLIAQQELYLNNLLKVRGYMYLSTIYESLGVKWDPEWENLCLLYKPGARITLAIAGVNGDGFDIDII